MIVHETGVSLGGGCLRGVAHIGALKEIVSRGIAITHLAGTSAGAVIGGLYACGWRPDRMEQALESLSVRRHLDFGFSRRGLLKGDRIYNTLLRLTEGRSFADLEIPCAVVCVDLHAGELAVLRDGELARALRAAIAIPGVFAPVEIGDKLLVDGYVLNNNPADVVRGMGARHVTAIRVISSAQHDRPPDNLLSSLSRYLDIASKRNTDRLLNAAADIVMDIDLVDVGRFQPESLTAAIRQGQLAASHILKKAGEEWMSRPYLAGHAQ